MLMPVLGSPSIATSGTPRSAALAGCTPLSQAGAVSKPLTPPPPEYQDTSPWYAPPACVTSVVPPTATTYGEAAGYSTSGTPAGTPLGVPTEQKEPVSPEDANMVWPCAAPCMRIWSITLIEPS